MGGHQKKKKKLKRKIREKNKIKVKEDTRGNLKQKKKV